MITFALIGGGEKCRGLPWSSFTYFARKLLLVRSRSRATAMALLLLG